MEQEKRQSLWLRVSNGFCSRQYGYTRVTELGKNGVRKQPDSLTMHVEEGRQTTKGIPCAYTLKKHTWYAAYEWRVHHSFLEKKNTRIVTNVFKVYGHRWCIGVENTTTGNLRTCLYSRNRKSVKTHFALTLVNWEDEKRNVCENITCAFSPFDYQKGVRDMATVEDVKNRCTRFLDGDYFTIRLELRIKCPESEQWKLCFEGGQAVCEWKLRYLREMSPSILLTDVFNTGGCTLSLEVRPHGSNPDSTDLDLLMRHTGGSPLYGCFACSILNDKATEANSSPETVYLGGPGSRTDWIHLAKESELTDESRGFVQDGWIILSARITFKSCRQFALEMLRQRRKVEEKERRCPAIDKEISVEIEEGTGSDNGIEHAHLLAKYKWYAYYEWCLHRSFLENPNDLQSECFKVDGRKWMFNIKRGENGELGLLLYSKQDTATEVHSQTMVVNFEHATKRKVLWSKNVLRNGNFGELNLCTVDELLESSSGFLRHDFVLVRLDLRLGLQDNEEFKQSVDGNTAHCEWKVRHAQLSPGCIISKEVQIDHIPINLLICSFKSGMITKGMKVAVMHVWKEQIRFLNELRVVNHTESKKDKFHVEERMISRRHRENRNWSLSCLELEDEKLGFVKNGWLTLEAKITLLDQSGGSESTGDVPKCQGFHANDASHSIQPGKAGEREALLSANSRSLVPKTTVISSRLP